MRFKIISVIPLYLPSDTAIGEFFKNHSDEVEAITKTDLTVVLAETVVNGNVVDVVSAANEDSPRYKGLRIDQLPCLWVDSSEGSFIIPLRNESDDVKGALRKITDCVRRSKDIRKIEECYMAKQPQTPNQTKVPGWFPIAGFATAFIFLAFLMYLILRGTPLDYGMRMLVTLAMSLTLALSFSFFGGEAAARGNIPLPGAQEHPVAFAVKGGFAVFVVSFLIIFWVYGKEPTKEKNTEITPSAAQQPQ